MSSGITPREFEEVQKRAQLNEDRINDLERDVARLEVKMNMVTAIGAATLTLVVAVFLMIIGKII